MNKKISLIVLGLLTIGLWAESVLESKLIQEGFGDFKFYPNGRYTYYEKQMSESLEFEGDYIIDSELIHFSTRESLKINGFKTDGEDIECGIPGKYRIDYEKSNAYYKGALVNIDTGMVFWSKQPVPSYSATIINGIECVIYPQQAGTCKYFVLMDNMRIRQKPSTKADTVKINGYESSLGYSSKKRDIEFAGGVLQIEAKTITEDTIDGITAPWFYVYCSSEINNCDGIATFGWIFGGYGKEISNNEYEQHVEDYKPLLIKKLKEAGVIIH